MAKRSGGGPNFVEVEKPVYVDLFSVIGDVDCSDETGFCCSGRDTKKFYGDWERKVCKPALEAQGYTAIVFLDGERDSFGPLTRLVHATDKDGVRRHFIYG